MSMKPACSAQLKPHNEHLPIKAGAIVCERSSAGLAEIFQHRLQRDWDLIYFIQLKTCSALAGQSQPFLCPSPVFPRPAIHAGKPQRGRNLAFQSATTSLPVGIMEELSCWQGSRKGGGLAMWARGGCLGLGLFYHLPRDFLYNSGGTCFYSLLLLVSVT